MAQQRCQKQKSKKARKVSEEQSTTTTTKVDTSECDELVAEIDRLLKEAQ